MSKVDFCHCNYCDTDVIVDMSSDVCPVCGRVGCLTDIEQDVDLETLIEDGEYDWEQHAIDVLTETFPDNSPLDALPYWENLATDAENIATARQILCE